MGIALTLVWFQAEQLDMSKPKATDFLKSHEANAVKAMTTWVTSAV